MNQKDLNQAKRFILTRLRKQESKNNIISNCNRKCKSCIDMKNGFCSIIFEQNENEPKNYNLDGNNKEAYMSKY